MPSLTTFAALLPAALACSDHLNFQRTPKLIGRQVSDNRTTRIPQDADWAYEASFNWGRINPEYELCQTGTQQSPIGFSLNQGLSTNHIPDFSNVSGLYTGNFYNWGYGPAFTLLHDKGVYETLPSVSFDNETDYLSGWHVHTPADHTVGGDRSKAELHYVFTDGGGDYRAVAAIRLDAGGQNNSFFDAVPKPFIGFNETDQQMEVDLPLRLPIEAVGNFTEFWTYRGSLTSPPCTEGVRFFMARNIMFVSDDQMREILRVGAYSARQEQEVWRHGVNE
ncbi:alpha carbonic anhydrase [Elsinoe ampelina]|uniref:Alpha carbonic anhydrase n=1 Tax=Elsinoe ampelina TaxID=302913 RepID=A0A6A6FYR3_9PEZI|nr:alpha carbonic anhydrase [Elsinoe ampelina]